jgi:hypothetical protein
MASYLRSALLALALLGSASAVFTCADSDNQTVCSALSTFFTATGGTSWTTNTDWGGVASYCTPWFGLTCTNGVVTALALNGNNLAGTVPDVFGSLTALTSLDLSINALYGTLPPSAIALCVSITCSFGSNAATSISLSADTAQLLGCPSSQTVGSTFSVPLSTSGILPAFLNSTSFAGFWGLALTTLPDLSSFTSLTSIALGSLRMTGTIPNWLSSLTALKTLDLSGNAFSGTIPDIWSSLSRLTSLKLYSNLLVGTLPPSFGSLLATIDTSQNAGLNGTIPASVLSNCAEASQGVPPIQLSAQFCNFNGGPTGTCLEVLEGSIIESVCKRANELTLPSGGSYSGSGSSFDPTSLQSTIASLTATIAAMNASHLATIAALQVNITAARTACSV